MLVLSRKVDERIVIDHRIKVVVVAIRGDKVRLGIDAPREMPVHREEIEARARQNSGGASLDLRIVPVALDARYYAFAERHAAQLGKTVDGFLSEVVLRALDLSMHLAKPCAGLQQAALPLTEPLQGEPS